VAHRTDSLYCLSLLVIDVVMRRQSICYYYDYVCVCVSAMCLMAIDCGQLSQLYRIAGYDSNFDEIIVVWSEIRCDQNHLSAVSSIDVKTFVTFLTFLTLLFVTYS